MKIRPPISGLPGETGRLIVLVIAALLAVSSAAGCTPAAPLMSTAVAGTLTAQPILPTETDLPTQTAYPTFTLPPSQTPLVIVVTATLTPTPRYTPTITPTATITPTVTITTTPTDTMTPTVTISPLVTTKSPGFYLVGLEIAPGVWRSNGSGDGCYWAITNRTGDILTNFYGMAGGTLYVPSDGFQVELQRGCGDWEYLGQP